MVSRQGAQRFPVRHISNCICPITALLLSLVFGGKLIEGAAKMEHRPADSRRRPTGSHGKARHADDGRRADRWFSRYLNSAVGQALERLCLDGRHRDVAVRGDRFCRRLLEDGEASQPGSDGQAEAAGPIADCDRRLGRAVCLTKYFASDYSWNVSIPFLKATAGPTGISFIGPILYLFFIIIVLLGFSNAVNLTDGLDGLAISVTFIAMTALTALTYLSSDARWARYLELTHRPEAAELTVFCGAMAGASLGFLWYNAPPAEVFMGDVGSLAIGGAMGTVAVLTKQEFMLLMVGGVFVIEALVGDAAGERFQDDQAHDRHRAAHV